MTVIDIAKAFVVGICVSVPFGPIAILSIQNTFSKGRKSGFVTGLGATVVDTTWALVSVFFLGVAEQLMDSHTTLIQLCGGAILIGIGISMGMSNPFRQLDKTQQLMDHVSPKDFMKSAAMGFSNPAAVLIMFAMVSAFGIDVSAEDGYKVIFVLMAIACGSASYWFTFSGVFSKLRKAVNLKAILWINRLAGIAVVGFGLYSLVRGIISFIKL
ncbi:MAG: LysE family transporter [Bacteroidales bacterium]|nr:LysE family transporter [Bacteroidales bacterium]